MITLSKSIKKSKPFFKACMKKLPGGDAQVNPKLHKWLESINESLPSRRIHIPLIRVSVKGEVCQRRSFADAQDDNTRA